MIVLAFRSDWPEVSRQLADISLPLVLGAAVLAGGGLCCSVLAWLVIIRSLGETVDSRSGSRIFLVSQVGKYLPGSVWAAVAQVQMGSERGVGRRANLASFFLSLLAAIAAGLVVGVLAWSILLPARLLFVVPALAVVLGVTRFALRQWPAVSGRLPATLSNRLPAQRPSSRALGTAVAILCVGWVLNGLQFYLLAASLDLEADLLIIRSVAAYSVAFVGGLLFIIAPAGAGVREGILVIVLGDASSIGVVTAAALLSRVVVTVVDVLGAAIGAFLGRRSAAQISEIS
jgi:uncharacterized membrane protein YbhN (UPF0104 family)